MIEMLAEKGMNVARLNMCHGSHDWHRAVIGRIREINARRGFNVGIMVDTEGSEVRSMTLDTWTSVSCRRSRLARPCLASCRLAASTHRCFHASILSSGCYLVMYRTTLSYA